MFIPNMTKKKENGSAKSSIIGGMTYPRITGIDSITNKKLSGYDIHWLGLELLIMSPSEHINAQEKQAMTQRFEL